MGDQMNYDVYHALVDYYIVNSKKFTEVNDPYTKFRSIKAAFHTLYSLLMVTNSLDAIKNYISVPLLEFLKKHSYLHPSLCTIDRMNYWVNDIVRDILMLKNEYDRFIARAFAINFQHVNLFPMPKGSKVELRNFDGRSLYAVFSFLPLASPDESKKILNPDNVLQHPNILILHQEVSLCIYSSSEGKYDDLADSPLYWEVVQYTGRMIFHISQIPLSLIPAFRHVTPRIIDNVFYADFSHLIPHLPDNFFSINHVYAMSPTNLRALTVGQARNYKWEIFANFTWSYFNEEVKEFIKSSEFRNTLLKDNIKINPLNLDFFEDLSILPYLESDMMFFKKCSQQLAYLPERFANEVQMYQNSLQEALTEVQWQNNAMELRDYFNRINLPMESDFEWYQPEVPEEYYQFNIEEIYSFESLFEGVPKGVWMAFFGFIPMNDDLWNSIFVLGNEQLKFITRLSVDPVFSLIFPWIRLAKSSRENLAVAVTIINPLRKSLQGTSEIIFSVMFSCTIHALEPSNFKSLDGLLNISNDWNSYPTLASKFPKEYFLSERDRNITTSTTKIVLYIMRELYFNVSWNISRPLPEVYFRCANGAVLFLVTISQHAKNNWCETDNKMNSELFKYFWNLIIDNRTGDSVMKLIQKFNMAEMLRKAVKARISEFSHFCIIERAIPLFHGLSFRMFSTFTIRSGAIIRALPPSFFAINTNVGIESCEALEALTYDQLKVMDSRVGGLNWHFLNVQTRESLLADKQFLLKLLKDVSKLYPRNWESFTAEFFADWISSCQADTILLIMESFDALPKILANVLVEYLRDNITKFYSRLLKNYKGEVLPLAIREVLSEMRDEKLLERTWKCKWSPRLLANFSEASEDGLMPHTYVLIRKHIFTGDNFDKFLQHQWTRDILTENEWIKLPVKKLENISTGFGKFTLKKQTAIYCNCLRYFHMMKVEMKIKVMHILVWGLFKVRQHSILTPEQWALLPNNIGDYLLRQDGVGRVLANNFSKMTVTQKEEVESFLLENMKNFKSWMKEAITTERTVPIFSQQFWSTEKTRKYFEGIFSGGRNAKEKIKYVIIGISFNWANLGDATRKSVGSRIFYFSKAFLSAFNSQKGFIVGEEVWSTIEDSQFLEFLAGLYDDHPYIRPMKISNYQNLLLNYPYMTAKQQAVVDKMRVSVWTSLFKLPFRTRK